MPSRVSTPGTCALCAQPLTSATIRAHLTSCAPTHDAQGDPTALIGLRITATHDARYWIYLEMRADAKLRHLDALLRALWLECCGHLSAFTIARRDAAMSKTAGGVLMPVGTTFEYEYDFGSTTALTGHVWMSRRGCIGRAPIRLLARNNPLALTCTSCSAAATAVCPYCPEDGIFCETHAATHEHASDEVYLPVVNSPRMGVCGYAG